MLVTAIGLPPLLTPDCRTACGTAVALSAIAADADIEYASAVQVAADLLPEDGRAVKGRVSHLGIMPSVRKEVKSLCGTTAFMIG